jgi:hypothetical protein
MSLDLSPYAANILEQEASRAGVSVDTLIERTFPPRQQQPKPVETSEQAKQRVFDLLAKWQAKAPLPEPPGGFKTLAELSAEWAAEDANMTEEEIAAERAFWEERERDFDKRPGISI